MATTPRDDALESTLPPEPGGAGGARAHVGRDGRDLLPLGTQVGRYRITGVLGAGGMGVVYAAHDPDLDRGLAIKILHRELREVRVRLLREGQAVARLTHPNVVSVHDVGTHGDDLFIAMERVRGQTLGAWLRAGPDRRRPWREVLARLIPAGRGLVAAHAAGLVHRDFKPENVLLGDDGRVVVTDFGLAQLAGEPVSTPGASGADPDHERITPEERGRSITAPATRTGVVLGTPAYMSPEQARGERADARSDQFSFCVALYEGVFGVRPFESSDAAPTVPNLATGPTTRRAARLTGGDVPRWLRRVLARGLHADPRARYPSMPALLAALHPRRRGLIGVGIGLAALAAILVAVLLWPHRTDDRALQRAGCVAVAAEGDTVWNDDARSRYRAGRSGELWLADELGWLDDYARRWSVLRREACLADRAAALTVRRESCLADALAALRVAIARTDDLWPVLPALDDCARPPPVAITFPATANVGPQGVAQLAPDGHRIAVSNLGGPPVIIDDDPGHFQARPIADALVVSDWLADGRMLLQRADRSQVLRGPAGGADVAMPGAGDLLYTQINVLSPDASRIAVADGDGIAVLATADGARLATIEGAAHEVAWEPDGHRLAVVSRNLAVLRILDTTTGAVVAITMRNQARGLGEVGMAWTAPGHLLLSYGLGPSTTYGLWTMELDEHSRLRRAPEVRWQPAPGLMLRIFDVAAGRVLLASASGRQRLFRFHVDHSIELPSSLRDLRLSFLVLATGEAVGLGGGRLVVFDPAGIRRLVPGDDRIPASLRDGAVVQIQSQGQGQWALVARRPDGVEATPTRFAWPERSGVPFLRCSTVAPDRCVVYSRDGEVVRVAIFAEPMAAPARLDDVTGVLDVSPDGRHVLVPMRGDRVVELDLASGRSTVAATIGQPTCTPRMVRRDPHVPGRMWLALLCPDRFALGMIDPGARFHEVAASDGWISGLEILADGDLLYSTMDWDPQLILLDGLAP